MQRLKIRDDVDLKELENMGFQHIKGYDGGVHEVYIARTYTANVVIFACDRGVYIEAMIDYARHSEVLAIIYNLTKAGIVEVEI